MIRADTDSDVWVLTLDRPGKANALTGAMLESLSDLAIRAARDKPAALILTGSGKVFSAGADLDAMQNGLAVDPAWERASGAIHVLPFPTIAALNGTVAGGAFGVVLACDMRVAVPGAKFFYPVMELGFLPQPSDPKRLSNLVGPSRAAMILLAGQKITASQALTWGLIDQISEDPLNSAREYATSAQAASPEHRAAIKGLLK